MNSRGDNFELLGNQNRGNIHLREDPAYQAIQEKKHRVIQQLDVRQTEFKRATQLYLRSLQREMNTFAATNEKINHRNNGLLKDVDEVMNRYKMGIENVRHSDSNLNHQKERLNQYIMTNFNGITEKIKRVFGGERLRIEKAIDEFNKAKPVPKAPEPEIDLFKRPSKEYMTNYQDLYHQLSKFITEQDDGRRDQLRPAQERPEQNTFKEPEGYRQHYDVIAQPSNSRPSGQHQPPRLSEQDKKITSVNRQNPSTQKLGMSILDKFSTHPRRETDLTIQSSMNDKQPQEQEKPLSGISFMDAFDRTKNAGAEVLNKTSHFGQSNGFMDDDDDDSGFRPAV